MLRRRYPLVLVLTRQRQWFAVMYKTIGRREAWFSVALSVAAALAISGAVRLPLELFAR